ncbi:hypothetical protein [Halorubellus litoreus]|uniref:Uncharacterized protein n=1 Tax=Halorubellus litoreus TaxID=755308 RepID=A0ABD5VCS7_9EURY
MIERRVRDVRRDGLVIAVGLVALAAVVALVPADAPALHVRALREFLIGITLGTTLSGVFRAKPRPAVRSTLALGVGFALAVVVDLV